MNDKFANPTLGMEFIWRYEQLIADGKTHKTAIEIMEYEFKNKLWERAVQHGCYFFNDGSAADYIDHGWDLHGY